MSKFFCLHNWVRVASLCKKGQKYEEKVGHSWNKKVVVRNYPHDLEEIWQCCTKCTKAEYLYQRQILPWEYELYTDDNGIIEIDKEIAHELV